jgi:hypothetical protein
MDLNEAVIRRFGQMSLALCEAEAHAAENAQEIANLRAELESFKTAIPTDGDGGEKAAQEMLQSR